MKWCAVSYHECFKGKKGTAWVINKLEGRQGYDAQP